MGRSAGVKVDPLAAYNAKRDFSKTAEPPGEAGKTSAKSAKSQAKALGFVVQKHAATRLHYDFRLELDGVLLSWAVTRGPSTDTRVRRLAVRTEDHPLAYGSFEGIIPKAEYGGGTVMLWDKGHWEPIDEPRAGVENGKFHFILHGTRMKGEWVLIRLKADSPKYGNTKAGRENWLLFKIADDHAGPEDLTAIHTTSVTTGRDFDAIAAGGDAWAKTKRPAEPAARPARKRQAAAALPPAFRAPQLATLVDTPPTGNAWLHETKYDGYRAILAVGGGKCVAYTRTGLDWTDKFGTVPAAAAALPCATALIDCEICALDADGRPSFGALQAAIKDGGPMVAFAFDLLERDGTDLAKAPLTERKAALAELLAGTKPPLIYAEHVRGGGERMFAALCDAGYEGVVSKQADAAYRSGRTKSWLKAKCTRRQEFIIGGWSTSAKGRGFASLLLGVQGEGGLRYAGRVGTGFDDRTLASLTERLAGLASDRPPFAGKLSAEARRQAHWVKPELVAEVAFAEFTPDGNVRHASFIGLRGDKPAKDVVAEKPLAPAGKKPASAPASNTDLAANALAGTGIKISSPDRDIFPDIGLTKQALAEYYALLGPAMLPVLANRPVSLVRCPQGRAKACFFQKHDSGSFGDNAAHVHRVPIPEKDGGTEDYLYVDSAAGIVACVQMGTIEFHGWGSRTTDLERPDRLVIDLDPDEALDFAAVKAAALVVRDRLKVEGLASLPMITGGKGIHIVAALEPGAQWPAVKAFAKDFAERLAADDPQNFTANMSKAKRGGRIFIDWLRNQRGATAVMPWSVRARPGAGVAVPLSWPELDRCTSASAYTAADPGIVLAMTRGRPRAKPGTLP